jgi:DNA-binding IclR family transcriptional regulator
VDTTPTFPPASSPAAFAAPSNPNSVRAVDRAAALLVSLGDWNGEVGVTELARRMGLHKSTASRLLATLFERGFVEQDRETGKYRLGLAIVRLGGQAEKSLDLRAIATPALQDLARQIKETATLGALENDHVVTLAWSDPSGASRNRVGKSLPLHATAPGKVLLSHCPERDVIRLSKIGFTPYTANTIVRVDLLLEELARVRKRGFATAFGENEPSVNAVAVPVYDHRASVVAALEVRASGNRILPSRLPDLISQIRVAAGTISASIGGVATA